MFFTLAVSAATPPRCAELTARAQDADPALLPAPGPAVVAWRSPDGCAALLHWGSPDAGSPGGPADGGLPGAEAAGRDWAYPGLPGAAPGSTRATSRARTIWAVTAADGSARVGARTAVTRVDPVYQAEVPGAVIVADRAAWAAAAASRLDDHDPRLACALLGPGFPLGSVTPFRGVSALPPATTLDLLDGVCWVWPDSPGEQAGPGRLTLADGAREVAAALTAAVTPLAAAGQPVQLSLTGGKDSRLIAAALAAAGVPVAASTHGFADHPDVLVAAEVARRLGLEHTVRTPAAPGQKVDVLGRIRATVLVADGMLSAFENVGRPDPAATGDITAGGHGGELLRGGYAETAAVRGGPRTGLRAGTDPARQAARAAELLRRLTTRHLGLARRGPAAGYTASLTPWGPALARRPLGALDDFYLVNRAGRWSAAARQAYLLREHLVQPLFDDRVVRAARAVPLPDRVSGALSAAVLAELSPALADLPLAGKPPAGTRAPFDWRRQYGEDIAAFLRGYVLDLGRTGGLFDVLRRPAAERLLAPPHADRALVWALATLACLYSGDYRHAREATPSLPVS